MKEYLLTSGDCVCACVCVCTFVFCQMSKHEEAVAEASRALSDDPTYTKAYERRAASLYDTGESLLHSRIYSTMSTRILCVSQPVRGGWVCSRVSNKAWTDIRYENTPGHVGRRGSLPSGLVAAPRCLSPPSVAASSFLQQPCPFISTSCVGTGERE